MKTGRKKTLFFAALTVLFLSIASATNLENIEDITALNSVIDIQDNVNMQGNRINNIANPNSGDDALPRSYADGRYLRRDGNNYMTGSLDLNNNDVNSVNGIHINDPGQDGDISFTNGAQIYNAPLDDSNAEGYLQLVNDGGIAFEPGSDGSTAATFTTSNNLNMNGNSIENVNELSTESISDIVPLSARGTGLNNDQNRRVAIGGDVIVNSGCRGLNLVVVSKSDYSISHNQCYDTYGTSSDSNLLADKLGNMTNSDIGILTSYDAWENSVTSDLDSAFRNVGLFKAAATVNSGSRRPYAAVFSGTGDSGGSRAQEVLLDESGDQPHAQIRGFLMDGSFVVRGSKQNNLIANQGNAVGVRVLNDGTVEIPNGNLDLGSSQISSVQDPDDPQDAATRSYVQSYADSNDANTDASTECSGQYTFLAGDNGCEDLTTNTASFINGDLVATNTLDSSEIDVNSFAGSGIGGSNDNLIVNWGAANDLGSNGGISDFSNANDLDGNGNLVSGSVSDNEIADNTVDNSEIQNGDNFDFGSTDVNGVLDVHHGSNLNGLRLINKVNDPDSPAPLLIATDDDGEDLAIEVRSDSDGTSVNTSQNYQDTADTSFKVWSDGRMDVANPSNTGRLLDIGGDANFNGQIDLNGNSIVNADWSNANDLDSNGGISDFSNANDLDGNGNVDCTSVSGLSGGLCDGTDNTIADNQGLADVLSNDNTANHRVIQDLGGGTGSINGGDIRFQPASSGGTAGLSFQSNTNAGSDGAWITWYDDNDNYNYWGDSSENGAIVISSHNDERTDVSDVTVLKSPAATVVDAPEFRLEGTTSIVDGDGNQCGSNQFLNGNGNCAQDDTIADNQNLGTSGNQITLDNGGSVTAPYADDADTVDGEQLTDILNDENDDVFSTDWNTLTEPGIHGVSAPSGEGLNSSNNQPASAYDYGQLIVTEGGGSNGLMQMYVSHHSASNGAVWIRTGWSDGGWDAWHAMPTREWVNNNDAYQDGDTSSTNELQDLEDVRSRDNVVSGGINFQSSGSISSLENLNVDSINSNKGSDPVDMDQGIDLDGSEIIDDSGSLTLGGGDVDIPDGNLRLQRTGNSWVSIDAGDNQWDYDGFRIRTTDENGNFETKMDITTGMSSSGADTARINFRNNDEYQFSDGRVLISDGQLNVGGNNINNIGGLQNCGANEFVNGNGNCETDTDTDTTIADNQNLGYSNDNAPTGSYATHTVTIDNGNNAQIRDYYDPDNTIPDDQDIQASATGDTIDISIDNGNGASATIDDDDASTRCSGNEVLMGDGTCGVPSTNPSLSDVVSNGNSIDNGQTVDTSSGTFRLPVGTNQY